MFIYVVLHILIMIIHGYKVLLQPISNSNLYRLWNSEIAKRKHKIIGKY